MKKLALLIGFGLIIWGILGLGELKRQRALIQETKPGYGIPEKDRERLARDNTIATGLISVGGLLFVWGLIPSFKPKKNAAAEAVPAPPVIPTPTVVPGNASTDRIAQLERLAKLKEQGVLTEEEFLKEKNKILG